MKSPSPSPLHHCRPRTIRPQATFNRTTKSPPLRDHLFVYYSPKLLFETTYPRLHSPPTTSNVFAHFGPIHCISRPHAGLPCTDPAPTCTAIPYRLGHRTGRGLPYMPGTPVHAGDSRTCRGLSRFLPISFFLSRRVISGRSVENTNTLKL